MVVDTAASDIRTQLECLFKEAMECRCCPRLSQKRAVLGPQNGLPGAPIMFIAEAPGRHGADRSGIPLHGDATGRNFEWLLSTAGFARDCVFVTNAVLCNPCDARGRNAPPTRDEIRNCSVYLQRQIDVVAPKVIVTLGGVALAAVSFLYGLRASLAADHRKALPLRDGRLLIPLFHPSPRVMNTRHSRLEQLADFQYIHTLAAPIVRTYGAADL